MRRTVRKKEKETPKKEMIKIEWELKKPPTPIKKKKERKKSQNDLYMPRLADCRERSKIKKRAFLFKFLG